jgi:hypothetical protein
VEDAVAPGDGRRHGAVVQQVGPEQPQPLRRAVQRRQVRVLCVVCAAPQIIHMLLLCTYAGEFPKNKKANGDFVGGWCQGQGR